MFYTLNIILIAILGMISSYTDIKQGKILNILVFPMMALGLILAIINDINFLLFFTNALIAFVFGFALYLARLWSAGDSKLFLAFAMLFPLPFYPQNFVLFPAFSLALNSFVPAFLALFLLAIIKTTTAQKVESLKTALKPKLLASLAVIIFAFYWIMFYVFSFIALPTDFFLIVLVLFLFISMLERVFPKKVVLVSAVLAAPLAALNVNELIQPNFWILFALIFVSMVFLRFFILYLGFFAFGKRIDLKDLKPGMVLLEGVVEKNGILEKKKLFFPSLVNAFQDIKTKYVLEIGAKGLSEKDIDLIAQKGKEMKVRFDSLLVQETLPFAPLLFVGTLLTFFCSFFLPWC